MQQPSILKPILILTSAAILLAMMHFAAAFLVPILLAFFLATLVSPVYLGLKRRRVPGGLALLLSIAFMVLVVLFLVLLVGTSLKTMTADLQTYSGLFEQRQAELSAALASAGKTMDLSSLLSAIDPSTLTAVLGFFLSTIALILKSSLLILLVMMFALAEGPQIIRRIQAAFGPEHFFSRNIVTIAHSMISYFGLRAIVNLVTAVSTGAMLWLFGIPSAGLWSVLIFFLSFVPYIGAVIAMIPATLLAYAQGGLSLAILIIVLATLINGMSENLVAPMVMGKGLSISPTVVFLSFIFWMFILGGPGAFLAMPLTVALILFMSSFEETRGIAAIMQSTTPPEPAPESAPAAEPT